MFTKKEKENYPATVTLFETIMLAWTKALIIACLSGYIKWLAGKEINSGQSGKE